MKYVHRFSVKAPLPEVVAFHRQSASMGAITPPPIVVRVHSSPALLDEGDRMDFTLWFGPLPLPWSAQIEQVTASGFVDRQLSGPYAAWVHRHRFAPLGENETEVVDSVQAKLKDGGLWRIVGMLMWLNMPILFTYHAWKTRRLLEQPRLQAGSAVLQTRKR